jgi:hypothetical protein
VFQKEEIMKLRELIEKLNKLAEEDPTLLDDEIYYGDCEDSLTHNNINKIYIEWDTICPERYLIIRKEVYNKMNEGVK